MGCLRAAILAASLLAATCDDEALWFFGADAEWTGPVGYLKNLMPDAEAVARAGTDARWSANASACGAPPLNHTCSPSRLAAPALPRTGDLCAAVDGLSILVVGDSYARHVYVALALLLSGDLRAGALKAGADGAANCHYAKQFGEHAKEARQACRLFVAKRLSVCGGRARLRLAEAACPEVTLVNLRRNQVVAYGLGAHPCARGGAKGPKHLSYNATAFEARGRSAAATRRSGTAPRPSSSGSTRTSGRRASGPTTARTAFDFHAAAMRAACRADGDAGSTRVRAQSPRPRSAAFTGSRSKKASTGSAGVVSRFAVPSTRKPP
ncbi:hypothetical protein JL721_7777 [Aureococcus anophagefferens]|nr:hypothetical protein JL721_7777 [Aureococcus anophagefferens]